MKYFSVTYKLKMFGSTYTPSICYPLTDSLTPTVEGLVAKKMAKIYNYKMRFVSGVARPVAPKGKPAKASLPHAVPLVKAAKAVTASPVPDTSASSQKSGTGK
jgi:hypothetical protein